MRKLVRLSLIAAMIWLVTLYGYALAVMTKSKSEKEGVRTLTTSHNYWSPNPALVKLEGKWDSRVWKWHEFLGCGSRQITGSNAYNYAIQSDNGAKIGMLTPPELDWVYVGGISVGSVWNDTKPSYQPPPLNVSKVSALTLETRIADWKGAPLSPIIFPSWYAVLTDVWFNVTNVVIEDKDGMKYFPSKILGIDIFYHTMTGSLNAAMGAGNEFSRVEPCNKNFIYSINLAGQDFYSIRNDGMFAIDLLALLQKAQQEAAMHGWHFNINNVELVMLEDVVESYWSYAYVKISWTGIRYCTYTEQHCAIE